LGSAGQDEDFIGVGLWSFNAELSEKVAQRAGIPAAQSRHLFDSAFGVRSRLAQVGYPLWCFVMPRSSVAA
jgi:hypothetical protein